MRVLLHRYYTARVSKSRRVTLPSLSASRTCSYNFISFWLGLNAGLTDILRILRIQQVQLNRDDSSQEPRGPSWQLTRLNNLRAASLAEVASLISKSKSNIKIIALFQLLALSQIFIVSNCLPLLSQLIWPSIDLEFKLPKKTKFCRKINHNSRGAQSKIQQNKTTVIIRIRGMEQFMQNLSQIKKRIEHGTSMCPEKEYPFMMFKCGFLFNRVCEVNKVISFMETVEFLKAEGKLTETLECHLINFLYERPELYGRISEILENIIKNKSVNVLIELEKLQQIPREEPIKNGHAPTSINPKSGQQKMASQDNRLTNNGTMILQDNHPMPSQGPNDNESEKTEKYDEDYFENMMKMNLESEALAKKLQEEEQMLAKSQKIPDDTVCEVCYVGLYDEEFLPLEACEHIFHKNCLAQYFKSDISENRFPLKCPSDKCGKEVKDSDIKQILASELYTKYEKHTLKHYADMHGDSISWCPTANCEYMFFFEKDDQVRFQCLECKKEYCLNCRVEWHKEMTCKEYQISNTTSADDEAFMKFVKGKKFKQCPKCKFWVEKNQGCDHMTCKCKFEFCYKCGGVFMKCQCVTKMQEEMERRRQQIVERRKKKEELIQRRKKKAQEEPAPQRSRRKRR